MQQFWELNQFHQHPQRKSLNNPQWLLLPCTSCTTKQSNSFTITGSQPVMHWLLMFIRSGKQSSKGGQRGTTKSQQMCQHSINSSYYSFSRAGRQCGRGWTGSSAEKQSSQISFWRTAGGDGEGGQLHYHGAFLRVWAQTPLHRKQWLRLPFTFDAWNEMEWN